MTPRNPGGCPLMPWHPAPTDIANVYPTAIVITGPTKVFIRVPKPTLIRPHPVAVAIGTPVASGGSRPEAIAVATAIDPITIVSESRIENCIVIALIILRNAGSRRVLGCEWFALFLRVGDKADGPAVIAGAVSNDNATITNAVRNIQ